MRTREYTVAEMKSFLDNMSGLYDLARVVDPIECRILKFHDNGKISMNERCYGIWGAEQKCVNCSSAAACRTGCHQQKEEHFHDQVFHMLKEGYTNLFDIACGYTPRSIYCARAGIDYVGVDVPVVAEELERLAQKIGLSQKHPTYMGADATNAALLTAAASLLQGAVLISCEGLALYLYAEEFEQLLGGIREVLLQHGGTWITSDMGVDYEAFATTCMSDPDAVKLYRKAKKAAMSSSNVYEDGVTF